MAIVQLDCDGKSGDFSLPFEITSLRAATYASGVVSVDDVLRNHLRSPPIVSANRTRPQPLLKARITFDLYTPDGATKYARDIADLVHAFDRFVQLTMIL